MSHIAIVVEVTAGASIDRVCEEAVALANLTGVTVQFKFNSVRVAARAGDDPDCLTRRWGEAFNSKSIKAVRLGRSK